MSIVRPFLQIPRNLAEWERFFREATLGDGEISNQQLRDSQPLSVIGRSANSVGSPADIQATGNDEFLVTRSGVLGFGAILETDLPGTISRDFTVVSHTVSATIDNKTINLASGTITMTLPTPVSGFLGYIKNIGTGLVTVSGTIDGKSSQKLKKNNTIFVTSDGVGYYIV